ncbi:MAG: hypothetical protein M0P64_02040 [Candidatus Pacebacteria bacterium]|nr:hypothetical protein [Candidatus Paceibacterota bacterium]
MDDRLWMALLGMLVFTVSLFVFVVTHFIFDPRLIVLSYFLIPIVWVSACWFLSFFRIRTSFLKNIFPLF